MITVFDLTLASGRGAVMSAIMFADVEWSDGDKHSEEYSQEIQTAKRVSIGTMHVVEPSRA